MFADSPFNPDISAWDVSSVTNMSYMFIQNTAFDQDINGWDVSSVTNMYAMFYGASAFDQDLSAWNVSNVINMAFMFNGTLSTENYDAILNGWAAQEVQSNVELGVGNTTFCGGHAGRISLENRGWVITDGGRAIDSEEACPYAFSNSTLKTAVAEWNADTEAATTKYGAINTWDVSSVTDMQMLFFDNARTFNEDISNWNVSNVTNMYGMFTLTPFNQDISAWDLALSLIHI